MSAQEKIYQTSIKNDQTSVKTYIVYYILVWTSVRSNWESYKLTPKVLQNV